MNDNERMRQIELSSLYGIARVEEARSAEARSLLLTALQTDGVDHKQFYMCEVLQMFMLPDEYKRLAGVLFDEGVAP